MNSAELQIPGYEILGDAGKGTYSEVYLARDRQSGSEVAIKLLVDDLVDYSQELRYASRLKEISSPFLASVLDSGRIGEGSLYLVLEWGGRELFEWMIERGALAPDSAYLALGQAAQGIRTLHRAGFVHLDISPANLFVDEGGNLRVSDFGMCVALTGRSRRLDSKPRGTPGYTAPEVLRGTAHVTSDVYSLGAVLHWMLTGQPPVGEDDSERPKRLLPDLPEAAHWIIEKALQVDPGKRFQTLADLEHHLDRAGRGVWRPPKRNLAAGRNRTASGLPRSGFWRRLFSL